MPLPLEAVPNFSEGRDRTTIDAIGAALARHAELLDVHTDPDHNRSVFTLVAGDAGIVDALVAGVAEARERIDLRRHEGAHPRIGAADVVPVVPIDLADMDRARSAARRVAERIAADLVLPVFVYGELAPGRGPAFFRRGGTEELARRLESGELAPDFGPPRLDERAGAVIVGARRPLIAFNVDLMDADLVVARATTRSASMRSTLKAISGLRAPTMTAPARSSSRGGPKSGASSPDSSRRASSSVPPRRKNAGPRPGASSP